MENRAKFEDEDFYFEDGEDRINNQKPNFNNVKYVNNEHYDMAYDINQPVSDESIDVKKSQHESSKEDSQEEDSNEEEEEQQQPINRNVYSTLGINVANISILKELPRFDNSQFYNLDLDNDAKELLGIMNRYKINDVILDTKLKPFIPNFTPCVSEVDAFIKMNRPDNMMEDLGLNMMDEPTVNGIDKTLFSIELSYKLKTKSNYNANVKILENAIKNPKQIQIWIDQIGELHKEKTSSTVNYTKYMPDVESLLQVWPEKMENALKDTMFPDDKLNIDVDNYAKTICNLLDIPVNKLNNDKGLIEALHLMFTVFLEFKNNQHFNQRKSSKAQDNVQSIKFS